MNPSTQTLYAVLNDLGDTVHSVDYTLEQGAHFLLTADSRSYEIRDEDGEKRLFWALSGHSRSHWSGFFGATEADIFQQIVDLDAEWGGYVAVPQHRPSGWWKIGPVGGEAVFGYGSRREAEEYADLLNDLTLGERTAVYHASPLSQRQAFKLQGYLVHGDLGCNLDEEIAALRERLEERAAAA
ncbi:hypothetical protein ELI16_14500 [Rhizobium ruizarguesonis]|uniref:hypothetical protein n=1 Tax=Rhizobium ruizarguesonis TaxID=2081791 RepID=UPI00103180B4|nr:hypothetical protein [Rhizobium ruizarguesonis]TAW73062.1 hypothetical protein ELI16_14500 [Rhizobium ruizarguesonis]